MSGHYCGKCGTPAGTEDVFCHKCGTELNVRTVSETEYAVSRRKICPQCGEPVPMGDRFCGNCGVAQAPPEINPQIHTKKHAIPSPGVTSHRRKRGFLFRLVSALLFWGVVAGAFYTVYRFLGRDILWSEVFAVVAGSGRQRQTADVAPIPPTEEAYVRSEVLPPIVPETTDRGDPPIVPEPVQAEQVPQRGPEWGEQDANGYSAVTLPGRNNPEQGGVSSMRGTVTGNRVNLRSEPNTRSQVRGQFTSGREVEITRRYWSGDERFFWYEVNSRGDSGWMYGEYLRIAEEAEE